MATFDSDGIIFDEVDWNRVKGIRDLKDAFEAGKISADEFRRQNPFFIFGGSEYYPNSDPRSHLDCAHQPRKGYIDGGIVLTKGFQITHEMMTTAPREEWDRLSDFIDRMQNLIANEVLPDRMYYVYDAVPVITTMES